MKKFTSVINDATDNFLLRLSNAKTGYLVALCVFMDIAVTYIFSVVLFPNAPDYLAFLTFWERLFAAVLLGPIVETLLIQKFLIGLTLKYSGDDKLLAILVSAIVFGLVHYYSIAYMIKAFIAGLLYGLLYFSLQYKNKNPVLYVMIAHSVFNSIGFIISIF